MNKKSWVVHHYAVEFWNGCYNSSIKDGHLWFHLYSRKSLSRQEVVLENEKEKHDMCEFKTKQYCKMVK